VILYIPSFLGLESGWDFFVAHRAAAASGEGGPTLIGFWREKDALGFCSNWHPSGLVFCGREFCTAEHWMMWQKALSI